MWHLSHFCYISSSTSDPHYACWNVSWSEAMYHRLVPSTLIARLPALPTALSGMSQMSWETFENLAKWETPSVLVLARIHLRRHCVFSVRNIDLLIAISQILAQYILQTAMKTTTQDCHTSRIGRSAEVQCNFFLACSQTYAKPCIMRNYRIPTKSRYSNRNRLSIIKS